MASASLKGLLVEELVSLLSIESQVAKALPLIRKGVATNELAATLKEDAVKTKDRVASLTAVLKLLKQKPAAMAEPTAAALLKSCSGVQGRYAKGNLGDAALLTLLLRLEYYRSVAYQSTFALAKQMGEDEILDLLKAGAAEDDLTAKRFGQIAIQVNAEAFMDTHSERCAPVIEKTP